MSTVSTGNCVFQYPADREFVRGLLAELGYEAKKKRLDFDVFRLSGKPTHTILVRYYDGQVELIDVVNQLSKKGFTDDEIDAALRSM